MVIKSAEFRVSSEKYTECPPPKLPEFAFIGRSNVGKSSLINTLVQRKNLAKVSGTPGKTQAINHFIINQQWYLVDLPGYGFAKVSRESRWQFGRMIENYLQHRENLMCTFVLLDIRLPLQKNDADFIHWVGSKGLPLALVLTKADKIKPAELDKSREGFERALLQTWETVPPLFVTSAEKKWGRGDLLDFMAQAMQSDQIH
ncbi:MAG: ribosome biogenesis GTP-binding protein YihA/YsxC [Cytophagales bacterium]